MTRRADTAMKNTTMFARRYRRLTEQGGNVPIVVETLVFDEGQITCPTNGLNPQWGGCVTRSQETPAEQS